MSTTVEEFLQRKGGVGLVSVLNDGGKTYSEIESEVAITSDTISKRKDEALDIGLVEIRAARRHGRTLNEYHLTDFGEAVAERLAVEGVVSNYHSMRMHQRKVEAGTDEVVAWLTDNPNHFMHFEEVTKETLIDRTDNGESEPVTVPGDRTVDMPDDVTDETNTETDGDEADDGRIQRDLPEMLKEDLQTNSEDEEDKEK
jgi:DNA-binding HxlR family transcriptional regulator